MGPQFAMFIFVVLLLLNIGKHDRKYMMHTFRSKVELWGVVQAINTMAKDTRLLASRDIKPTNAVLLL